MKKLIGDIGGSNSRFALIDEGIAWEQYKIYRNDEFSSFEEIVKAYLDDVQVEIESAAFAAAGPVSEGNLKLTNRGWLISAAELKKFFHLEHCLVVNDFCATALGIPALNADDIIQVGGNVPNPVAPIAIIGPGTGLGVSGLVPSAEGGNVLVTEGGHITAAARDDRTAAILARLRQRFAHVSAERVISGQGIENLYQTLSEIDGLDFVKMTAAEVGAAALEGQNQTAVEAMEIFFTLLGGMAGDLALSYGAFGGVYVAGGIVRRYLKIFHTSGFREAFNSKGRMSDYVQAIPAFVIVREHVELLGLAASLHADVTGQPWPQVLDKGV